MMSADLTERDSTDTAAARISRANPAQIVAHSARSALAGRRNLNMGLG
jgi:hypothetical protein